MSNAETEHPNGSTFLERSEEQRWKDLARFMENTYGAIHMIHSEAIGDTGGFTVQAVEYRLDELKEILDSRPF